MPGTPVYSPYPPPKPASKRRILIIVLVVGLGCGGILVAMLMPEFGAPREAVRRCQCQKNLREIGLALFAYYDKHKCFPPAVTTDDHGKPMMSWRVAILPYLEQQALYRRYDSKQPWDSPQNRALGKIPVPYFRCPSDPGTAANPTETNYVRIVGKDTVGGTPNEAVKINDITDGTANTILVAEVTGLHINWEEPRNVTVEEFMEMVAKGHVSFHSGGFQAVMADGSTHFICDTIDPKTLRALLLRNDGQPVGDIGNVLSGVRSAQAKVPQ